MAVIELKPITPGQRFKVVVKNELYKGRPVESLTEAKKRSLLFTVGS